MEVNISEMRKRRRPLWMTHFGVESMADMLGGGGDLWTDRLSSEWAREYGQEFVPNFDFYEKEGNYYLSIEVPGCAKEDLSVSIQNRVLSVTGRKAGAKTEEGRNYYMKESKCGSFSRTIRLPEEIDHTKVEANMKEGILTITLPAKNPPETKKISIA
jgi:HSP20 family protein